jgi:hypothetical protein
VALLAAAWLVSCGGGDDDAAADNHCRTVEDQFDQVHKLCCKEQGEVATYGVGCGLHVAIGCEGRLYCTFYTDDDEETGKCLTAKTCGECVRSGDTGALTIWCHDKILE